MPIICGALLLAAPLPIPAQNVGAGIQVPVTYDKLSNGLKVVLSPDKTAPAVVVVGDKAKISEQLQPFGKITDEAGN